MSPNRTGPDDAARTEAVPKSLPSVPEERTEAIDESQWTKDRSLEFNRPTSPFGENSQARTQLVRPGIDDGRDKSPRPSDRAHGPGQVFPSPSLPTHDPATTQAQHLDLLGSQAAEESAKDGPNPLHEDQPLPRVPLKPDKETMTPSTISASTTRPWTSTEDYKRLKPPDHAKIHRQPSQETKECKLSFSGQVYISLKEEDMRLYPVDDLDPPSMPEDPRRPLPQEDLKKHVHLQPQPQPHLTLKPNG